MHATRIINSMLVENRNVRNLLELLESFDPNFSQYYVRYFHLKSGSFLFLGEKIPTSQEWITKSREVKPALADRWMAEKFHESKCAGDFLEIGVVPRVTCLISLYNSDDYLEYFLSQLMHQTVLDQLELIFLAVKPGLNELKILHEFFEEIPGAQLITYEQRIGVYEAWNDGIRHGKAPLITNINVDDFRAPNSLQTQIELMDRHPEYDVLFQDFFLSLYPNISFEAIKALNFKVSLPLDLETSLKRGFNYPHHAPMWRRKLHEQIGLFDESFKSAGDFDFWLRAAKSGVLFLKGSELHTAYYMNSKGLSTKIFSRGLKESRIIRAKYHL